MAGLLDALQSASNAAASNVSGPVDVIAWLLRKAGIPVPEQPIGGSDWMARQGLTKQVPQGAMQVLGETAGLLTPIAAAAKAPQIARGLLEFGAPNAMPGVASGQRGALVLREQIQPSADAARQAVNFERGWWRGGEQIKDGRKSGNWYTREPEEAADYARRIKNPDVREYAVPSSMMLKTDKGYSPKLAHDAASKVESMGPEGAKAAALFRTYGPNEQVTGLEVWMNLKQHLGADTAADVLQSLGFKSVRGVNGPDYLLTFPKTTVRDAQRAKFDPQKLHIDDIMAGVGGLGLSGLLAANSQGRE